MPRAFGYCRASTSGQHYTFEAQRRAIESYFDCQLQPKGYVFGGWFEDRATSGAKPLVQREAGKLLWAALQRGDCIVWSRLDRAFRNVIDGASTLRQLDDMGVAVHSLDIQLDTSSALGRFVTHLLILLGELERNWISNRTREALAIRQQKGLPHGGRPPAGWRKLADGTWTPDETERQLIDWAVSQHAGGTTWDRLVARLKKLGIRRANGDGYHQCWFHYAVKAKAAGYPGRDGWRTASVRLSKAAVAAKSEARASPTNACNARPLAKL